MLQSANRNENGKIKYSCVSSSAKLIKSESMPDDPQANKIEVPVYQNKRKWHQNNGNINAAFCKDSKVFSKSKNIEKKKDLIL